MDKTAIKNFSIWARTKLRDDIKYLAMQKGVTELGIMDPLPQSTGDLQFFDIGTRDYAQVSGKEIRQRNALVKTIRSREHGSDYKTAYNAVIEEIAYTWFNRLVAIRFMEVNDYLPSRLRVLSSENAGKAEPDLVTTPFDGDLDYTPEEEDKITRLKDENRLDELFRMLFIRQCNKLGEILPRMFQKTDDYTELLFNISFTDRDGIVRHLVDDISEDNWTDQVQIIGWLYQYYNTELKDETFALLKKNVKITKERVPAATQLFTPDWIVRYMVQNSLGRLWIEGHPNDNLKAGWKYYLEEAEQEPEVQAQLAAIRREYSALNPEQIRCVDPCTGSGHILVCFFDMLMQIYESQGYTGRDAARSIVENNLWGLDIDERAAQLAYFAVMMKARQYDRRIFFRGVQPHVYVIEESNGIDTHTIEYFANGNENLKKDLCTLMDELRDAKEYGSILNVTQVDFAALYARAEEIFDDISMYRETILNRLVPLIRVAEALAQKYHAVVTNPPYMAISNANPKVQKYVKDNYPDSKSDLFAVFMERCEQMTAKNCYQAMITQHAWMFLSSFEKLRTKLLTKDTINMAHLGARAFEEIGGEVVQTTSFVLSNRHIDAYAGTYCRLIEPTTQQGKEDMFLACENRYTAQQSNFSKIPGSPVAYWVGEAMLNAFMFPKLYDIGMTRRGLQTGNKEQFIRFWYEPKFNEVKRPESIVQDYKWAIMNNGGNARKWYGEILHTVLWKNNGEKIKSTGKAIIPSEHLYFKECITWNRIAGLDLAIKYQPPGIIQGDMSPFFIASTTHMHLYAMALVNSVVAKRLINVINPTITMPVGDVAKIPIAVEAEVDSVVRITNSCISLSRTDWDSFETSWDFRRHPLVRGCDTVADAFTQWEQDCLARFNQLKANEEELNCIFIDIYGLQDELTPEVADKDVTVRKADLQRDIRSLLSYAVGCMFGRYSLDEDGLAYAGGEWDGSKYSTFIPDADNAIPITDEAYFEDDIVGLLCAWLKKVYGADTLEQNLTFIAGALGNKGDTSRQVIRNYFLNDFIKDHIKTYQKRPIYWMFDSGKQNGFKCLVYMHRWNADTVGNVRVEYLHKLQHVYEREIVRMQETIDEGGVAREVSKATRRKDKLAKQLKETKEYDAQLAHIALSRIAIDLDDGVKVNYEKVQTGRDGKKVTILAKI